jgi:hypothetical protein
MTRVTRRRGELKVRMLLLLLLGVVVRPNVLCHRSLNERAVGEGWLLGCVKKKVRARSSRSYIPNSRFRQRG